MPATPSGPVSAQPLWTVASGLNQPDDILFRDGSLYIGELGSGKISVVVPGKPASRLNPTIPKVEGLAFIGETLYAADQQSDQVHAINGDQVTTLIQLQPVAGKDNVDGIAAAGDQLIVPDSPQGVVDWVDRSGRIVKTVGGFVRPTGAWPLPDGSTLVADEYGNSAVRLAPDGSRSFLIQGLPIVDDVAADADGHVFVVTPVVSGGRLAEVSGGQAHDLVGKLLEPQGIAFDAAGNVFVSESAAGRVDLAIRSFKLVPLGTAHPAAGQPLCVDLVRAPGFSGTVELSGDAGLKVVRQPGAGSQGEVIVSGCQVAPCRLTASSGTRSDMLWIAGP